MQITIVSAGKIIPASELISATLRTDLVPIPASIEFTVQSTTELDSLLKEGEQLTVNDISHPFELIKVTPLKTQTIAVLVASLVLVFWLVVKDLSNTQSKQLLVMKLLLIL